MKKRVLQGMRPTGRLHLGNYLGTAKGMVQLQNDPNYETFTWWRTFMRLQHHIKLASWGISGVM
jgi:hypothetical protein